MRRLEQDSDGVARDSRYGQAWKYLREASRLSITLMAGSTLDLPEALAGAGILDPFHKTRSVAALVSRHADLARDCAEALERAAHSLLQSELPDRATRERLEAPNGGN